MAAPVKTCERCGDKTDTVKKTAYYPADFTPRRNCRCGYLCEPCRRLGLLQALDAEEH